MGYSRAGFDVVGVDIHPQPRYPFEFIQADAMTFPLDGFDAVHASPPCQAYSMSKNMGDRSRHLQLIEPVRQRLHGHGRPWVMENVELAPLRFPVRLCGATFRLGLPGWDLPRHRLFECSFGILTPPCQHKRGHTIGIYGGGTNGWHMKHWGRSFTIAELRQAIGIEWMTRAELNQAIPPAYTEFIGKHLMQHLEKRAT